MYSVGVFSKTQINGKSFLTYNFSSQTDNPSSSASGETSIDFNGDDNDLSFKPLFLCPSLRLKAESVKLKEIGYYSFDDDFALFGTPPHFPNISSGLDQDVQSLLDSESHEDICKLPVSLLFWCNNEIPNDKEFYCGACESSELGTDYYLCVTCGKMFHKECLESPLEIKHPSYPFLSIQLYNRPSYFFQNLTCACCKTKVDNMFYHCLTSELYMHPFCAMKPIPIVIDHPKRHPHPLTFFPKQSFLPCNVCGLVNELIPTYLCLPCVYTVHQDCIYFPNVIRISRHQHRLSFTSSRPSAKLSCRVCRQKLDKHYGAYSCNRCDDYFVHPRCVSWKDSWDGEELEGVPEEPEIVVKPFQEIAHGIILHFSHSHNLKLKISRVYDEDKFCQACVLPIYKGSYYSCVDQCDFILHEACAYSPLKKYHLFHARPLTLKVVPNGYEKNKCGFWCDACGRQSCGFVYEDLVGARIFRLDLRCASFSEQFSYESLHKHSVFIPVRRKEENSATCQVCQDIGPIFRCSKKLKCIECNYIICFKCVTLPNEAMYKHDKHLLRFREGKKGSDESGWCEVCERKMVYSREKGYYACDDYCCTTIHVDCLLGTDPYVKPGQTIDINEEEVHILRNDTMTRPFCHGRHCKERERRCLHKVIFEKKNMTFCSYNCARTGYEQSWV